MNLKMKLEREKAALSLKQVNVELEDVTQELLEIGRKPGGVDSHSSRSKELEKKRLDLREGQSVLSQELELYDNLLRSQEQKVKK